jgi:hypothetical protein
MNAVKAILLLSTLCGYCMAGSTYQTMTSPSEFFVMAADKTPKVFFTGEP